jgi:hypothetical protein
MIGHECTKQDCSDSHELIGKVDATDGDKILDKVLQSRYACLNPALKGNQNLLAWISDQHRSIFPPNLENE